MVKKNWILGITGLVGLCWSLFQLYVAGFGAMHVLIMRPIHIAFAVALTFLVYPLARNKDEPPGWIDLFLAAAVLTTIIYVNVYADRLVTRISFVHSVNYFDMAIGFLLIVGLLEACRRSAGWPLTILVLFFIGYIFAGPYLPSVFQHRGISLSRFVDLQLMSTNGMLGVATGASSDYIFYFVLFSAFLKFSGAGQLFVDGAIRFTGRMIGGPAKAAIVASSLMGTVSGSSAANVVGTGVFTIPLMKKAGFPSSFAGAVEAVASTGGQLMPPIMGAGAFVLAEMLGIPYVRVAQAALIPSIIFYLALFVMVDLKSRKEKIIFNAKDLPKMDNIKERIHLLVPLIILIYYIISGYSLMTAAFRSIIAIFLISFLRRSTRFTLGSLKETLISGAKSAISVAIPCAAAGVIVGIVVYTGLGVLMGKLIMNIAAQNLVLALLLVAIGCIIFGMGMPTTAAYIIGAILLAPVLVEIGVPNFAAHMFIFYFAIVSTLTPPVALSSYAAAGIADAPMWDVSLAALKLALVAFIIPFAFVYNVALLWQGSAIEIMQVSFTATLSTFAIGASLVGYFMGNIKYYLRVGLFIAGILLIAPELYTDLIGFTLGVAMIMIHLFTRKKIVEDDLKAVSS